MGAFESKKIKLNKNGFKDIFTAFEVIAVSFAVFHLASRVLFKSIDNSILKGFLSEIAFALPVFVLTFVLKKKPLYKTDFKKLALGWSSAVPLLVVLALAALNIFFGNVSINSSAAEIIMFTAQMLLIGYCEETLFRGFLQNAFHKLYGEDTVRGVRLAVFGAGGIFGCIHLLNALHPDISIKAAAAQAASAVFIGACLGAVYFRTGKCLWYNILLHALNDAVVGVANGTLSGKALTQVINETNSFGPFGNILPVIFYGGLFLFLLRRKKTESLLIKSGA